MYCIECGAYCDEWYYIDEREICKDCVELIMVDEAVCDNCGDLISDPEFMSEAYEYKGEIFCTDCMKYFERSE